MTEPVAIEPTPPRADDEQSSRRRWLRLLRSILWFGGFIALISFAGDCLWNLWAHNFGVSGITKDLLASWLMKALANGIVFGSFLEFPAWLAREKFPPPKRRQRH